MHTIQIELTNDPPRKWSTNIEHLTIFDLTSAVLKKLAPRGECLRIHKAGKTDRWLIELGGAPIGAIIDLTKPRPGSTQAGRGKEAAPPSKPVVKRKKSPRRRRTPGGKTKAAA